MSYDNWITSIPDPKTHDLKCICFECHKDHIKDDLVDINAHEEFECCEDQIRSWVKEDKRCALHPHAYYEPGNCEACVEQALLDTEKGKLS